MAVATYREINSFIGKFSELSNNGFNAMLQFRSCEGNISVQFEADLGFLYAPPSPKPCQSYKKTKPTQVWRRKSRKAVHTTLQDNVVAEFDSDSGENKTVSSDLDYQPDVLEPRKEVKVDSPIKCSTISFDQGSHINASSDDDSFHEILSESSKTCVDIYDETLPLLEHETLNAKVEDSTLDRPISELTRDEFYAMMNSCLGLNIQPPQSHPQGNLDAQFQELQEPT